MNKSCEGVKYADCLFKREKIPKAESIFVESTVEVPSWAASWTDSRECRDKTVNTCV